MKKLSLLVMPMALACGQSGETDLGEIAGYAGGIFGIGSHPSAGVTFATALSRYAIFGAELGFMPLGAEGFNTRTGSVLTRSRLFDFNGHVHVRIPVRQHVEPYVTLGAGLLHSSAEIISSTAAGGNVANISDNDFAFHIGGGLRYFIKENWGVRPEWKYYISDRNFSKLSIGVFYQFP